MTIIGNNFQATFHVMFSISKQDRNMEISKEYMKYLHNNLSKILLNDIVQTKLTIIEAKRSSMDRYLA